VLHRDGGLAGAMPLYLKGHSRGEYVFDHSWAEAFHRNGIPYYPKLLSSIPFTPVTGPRLLANNHEDKVLLANAAVELATALSVSSLHILFPEKDDIDALKDAGFLLREGVQFHWDNADYQDFDAFLAALKMEKRKKIRQERRRVQDAGVSFRRLSGTEVGSATLEFFYRCYASTYESHFSSPYLTLDFFRQILKSMPENLLFVIAEQNDEMIAAALNVVGGNVMYGRYWGTLKFVSGLHFETCYLQGIEHCIEAGLQRFEGGAQGEHKISRGLVPTATWSAHWIADARFSDAIAEFLERETAGINQYIDELEEHTPFRQK
jgi:predicted N-acyltransferase